MGLVISASPLERRCIFVSKSSFIHAVYLLMQKHRVRRSLGWAPVLAEGREPNPSQCRARATSAFCRWAQWPGSEGASGDKHCRVREAFSECQAHPLVFLEGDLPPLLLRWSWSSSARQRALQWGGRWSSGTWHDLADSSASSNVGFLGY